MKSEDTVTINGQPRPLGGARTVTQLLDALGLDAARMAVEHNGRIIPPAARPATPVNPGDALEIIQFVGGG